jgi:hypothetical protein
LQPEGCHKQIIKNIQIWIASKYRVYFQRLVITLTGLAKAVKVCHDGAGKRPCNKGMTTVPQDEGIKVSTAMSSSKRVCPVP